MSVVRFILTRPVLYSLLLGTAVDNALAAQHSVPDALITCIALTDDGQRLACFDEEIARLTPVLMESQTPIAEEPTSADTAAVAEADVDDFGMTAKLASEKSEEEDDSLNELTAVVVALRKRPHGELVVTLENGQVWTQSHAETGLLIREGDTVTIQRGLFGSYRITGRGKKTFAVERIE